MDVVFHLSSGDVADWERALANVGNLLADDDADADDVALLANGDAVRLFTEKSSLTKEVRSLGARVRCLGCRNSVEGRHIPRSEILANVELVSSGVGALTRLQRDGYAYLKVP